MPSVIFSKYYAMNPENDELLKFKRILKSMVEQRFLNDKNLSTFLEFLKDNISPLSQGSLLFFITDQRFSLNLVVDGSEEVRIALPLSPTGN